MFSSANGAFSARSALHIDHGMAACWWRTSFPSLALLLMTAAFIITKAARDAMYFQQDGLYDLPKVYLLIMLLSLPAAVATLTLMRWLGPRKARVAALLGMALFQVLFFAAARPGGGLVMTLFFTLVPVLYGVLLSLVWLLGGDLLEYTPRYVTARLYSTMGASSMLGGLAGALAARKLAAVMGPPPLLLVAACLLLAAAGVILISYRVYPCAGLEPQNPGPMPAPQNCSLSDLHCVHDFLHQPYPLLLMGVGMLASLAGVLIEFQFYLGAAATGRQASANLKFFSNFYIALSGAALTVQVLLVPLLQRRLGVYGSLLILPTVLTGLSGLVVARSTSFTRSLLRVAEGGIKSSIHRSNWEQAYLPLERVRRALAKLVVEGIASRTGEGVAALLLLWWIQELVQGAASREVITARMNYLLLGCCAGWVVLTGALKRSRRASDLIPESQEEYRADLPLPDG